MVELGVMVVPVHHLTVMEVVVLVEMLLTVVMVEQSTIKPEAYQSNPITLSITNLVMVELEEMVEKLAQELDLEL
ncbi:MAG: hypothetical protein Q8N97_02665 [Methanobacteriaceae archaeon]|nr:hypothetical protein [Methanobacteriaceae archaeon]